jgi:hypothetical protein
MIDEVPTIRAAADELVTRAETIERGALRVVSGITGLSDDDLVAVTAFCAIGSGASWWLAHTVSRPVDSSYYFQAFVGSFLGFAMLAGTALTALIYRFARSALYRRRLRTELEWLDGRLSRLEERASDSDVSNEIDVICRQSRRIVQAIADDTLGGLSIGGRATKHGGPRPRL